MRHQVVVALATAVLAGASLPGLAMSHWLGAGISCEPVDISGGGFFADVMWNVTVLDLGGAAHLSLRPMFGVGPLPLEVSLLIFDAFAVFEFRLERLTLFAGVGYGVAYGIRGGLHSSGILTTLGLSGVPLADALRMYVQIRTRGTGFFLSPGFGLQFRF